MLGIFHWSVLIYLYLGEKQAHRYVGKSSLCYSWCQIAWSVIYDPLGGRLRLWLYIVFNDIADLRGLFECYLRILFRGEIPWPLNYVDKESRAKKNAYQAKVNDQGHALIAIYVTLCPGTWIDINPNDGWKNFIGIPTMAFSRSVGGTLWLLPAQFSNGGELSCVPTVITCSVRHCS